MMWLPLLLVGAAPAEMTLTPKVWGDVVATLSVRIADQTPQPGTARVRLRLTVEGPADLSIELRPLDDALSGWRVPLRTSSIRPGERCVWECTLDLVQVKPGVLPLPGVRIGVQAGGVSGEIAWPDLLHESADVAPVVEVPPPPSSPWPGRLRWAGFAMVGLFGLAGVVFGVRRWIARPVPALPPLAAALAGIDRVRRSSSDPLHLVAELDGVLRVYLETLGIPATRLTGVELRVRLGDVGRELASILARGEELKFAGGGVRIEQVREMAEGARRALLSANSGSSGVPPVPGDEVGRGR